MLRQKTTLSRSSPLRTSKTRLEYKVWRRCHCGELFQKRSMSHIACSPACAIKLAAAKRERAEAKAAREERKADRARKEALKTRSDYIKEAQRVFNKYVRTRDAGKPCICCGRLVEKEFITGSNWDCGHYRSTGSAPHLRFHLWNAHRQLVKCNQWGAGRAVDYRVGLIARIGLAKVEALEADQTPRKHDIEWLKRFIAIFRKKTRRLEKRRGI